MSLAITHPRKEKKQIAIDLNSITIVDGKSKIIPFGISLVHTLARMISRRFKHHRFTSPRVAQRDLLAIQQ